MLDIRKNSQISTPNSQISIAPVAEEFYKRGSADKNKEEELLQFLSFIVDDEEYTLELSEITEVIKTRDITDVPHVPPFIAGIISLRGEIIYIMNLQERLGLKDKEISPETRIIIAKHDDIKIGLIVDKIMGAIRVNPKEIESTSNVQGSAGIEFIRGMVHHKDRLIMLLNLPMLLAMKDTSL